MDIETLQRAYEREKAKRAHAESLLEDKSRELFLSYEALQKSHDEVTAAHEELVLKQKQLVQSEKMASLGIISAGVAHEINNPIGFVLSNVVTLGENVASFNSLCTRLKGVFEAANDDDQLRASVSELATFYAEEDFDFVVEDGEGLITETTDGIVRVRDIVAGLKSFARVDTDEKTVANINECIESTLKILDSQTKYACDVKCCFAELPEIMCFPGKLNQVFMNLIVNAVHAVEEDGVICVSTTQESDSVTITVPDNGKGIAPEHLEDLFTPFFTTKPVGEGTGLGLSISHGIIEEHGGTISVDSTVGEGTTFTVTLPA